MGKRFTSGLLAGAVAAVIWISISLTTSLERTTIGLGGLCMLVGTTLLTMLIASLVAGRTGGAA